MQSPHGEQHDQKEVLYGQDIMEVLGGNRMRNENLEEGMLAIECCNSAVGLRPFILFHSSIDLCSAESSPASYNGIESVNFGGVHASSRS